MHLRDYWLYRGVGIGGMAWTWFCREARVHQPIVSRCFHSTLNLPFLAQSAQHPSVYHCYKPCEPTWVTIGKKDTHDRLNGYLGGLSLTSPIL